MSPTLGQLCSNTYTTTDLHRRLGLLQESLEEVLYHGNDGQPLFEALHASASRLGKEDDANAIMEWGETVWGSYTQHNFNDQIGALKDEALTLPSMTLYVPVHFDTEASQLVGAWCRENIDPHLMLEVLIDPNVTGGCAFVYKDTYHDLSLRLAMEQQSGVVTELLASYA